MQYPPGWNMRQSSENVFKSYLRQLLDAAAASCASVIVAGDFQVAMTHDDESISLTESPGSTLVERNSHRALLGLGLTDSFRHLHPYTRKYTCFSTWSKWAGPDDEAAKRIDLILSPMFPLDAIILPRNNFSDQLPSTSANIRSTISVLCYFTPSTPPVL